jgi:hypothetical protein
MSAFEKHYTVAAVATMWSMSASTVRRIFGKVPGVIKLGRTANGRGARKYRKLLIPETILRTQYVALTK